MSEFRFACPHCGQRMTGDAAYKGQEITCPACQKSLTVPAPVPRAPLPHPPPPPPVTAAPIAWAVEPAGQIPPLALVAFVCSFGLGLGSIPGIVCGHLARARIRRDPVLGGKHLATAGLVISYGFLLSAIGILLAGFFLLRPAHGHQLSAKAQAANTPAVLSARRVDEVKIGDPLSESEHQLKSRFSRRTEFMNRPVREAVNGGAISYVMKVDPSEPMSLYCTYWGNDSEGRRFDILVNDKLIATQNLDFNDPGHFFDVEYEIPGKLTRGKTRVTVLFQAYPGKTAGGIYGLQMLKR